MPIEGYEKFTYLGYTLGGEKPTLYFKEGRYTQVHEDSDNVGWHPVNDKIHHQLNISPQEVHEIMKIPPRDPDEQKFCRKILIEKVITGDRTQSTACLFECDMESTGFSNIHVSRGKLIDVGSTGFNMSFGEEYAKKVLSEGHIAKNELH